MLSDSAKLSLMTCLYDVAYTATDSFEPDNIGSDLAYLFGAILRDNRCEFAKNNALLAALQVDPNLYAAIQPYIQFGDGTDTISEVG